MTAMSSSLLELILDLLSDEDELKKYEADSQKYLFDRGAGGCAAEVDDAVRMSTDMAPTAHAVKGASAGAKKDDHGDHGDGHGHGHGHGHGGGGVDVTNHYTTNNSTHNDNGDKYHITAEDDGQVALNGGINVGDDIEGNLRYEPEGSFNENGSGVQINGEDAYIDGDLNSAGGSGSTVNTGVIDSSSSDDDTTIEDNVVQSGRNNQNESDGSNQETEESAAGGGDVSEHEVDVDVDVSERGPGDQELFG